jgi:hypothetical protein
MCGGLFTPHNRRPPSLRVALRTFRHAPSLALHLHQLADAALGLLSAAAPNRDLEHRLAGVGLGFAAGREGVRRGGYETEAGIDQPAESRPRIRVADDFESELAAVSHVDNMSSEPCAWLSGNCSSM